MAGKRQSPRTRRVECGNVKSEPQEIKQQDSTEKSHDGNADDGDVEESSALSFKTNLQQFNYTPTTSPSNNKRPLSTTTTIAPSPSKKPRLTTPRKPTTPLGQTSKYAPPSKYAHLSPLTDILTPNLICIFIGTNPGIQTATTGHAYAHPSNLFWKLLHSSGCTPDARLHYSQDVDLPRLYCMGNTNIVSRPSRDAAELSKSEMAAGTVELEEKVRRFRPESVCVVGKGIWEAVWRWRYGRAMGKGEFRWGWQDEGENLGREEGGWQGARVFVATSSSGHAASLRPAEKEAIWRPFGEWVKQRRRERFGVEGRIPEGMWDVMGVKKEEAGEAEEAEYVKQDAGGDG